MDWTKQLVGRQVSPKSIEDLCAYGAYGKVLDIALNQVVVRWADGRVLTHLQSALDLVDVPLPPDVRIEEES